MAHHIIEQAKRGLKGFEIGYYHTSGCYGGEYEEEFYKYFADDDFETRKYSIVAFTCMLGTWETKFCQVFWSVKEWEENSSRHYPLNKSQFYYFEDYLHSFLEHHEQIEKEFPYMFEEIVHFLIKIEQDRGISYEKWFPEIKPTVIHRIRQEILIPKKYLAEKNSPMKYLLKEIGIEPFFEIDKY
ncbi:hypothetical protein MKY51_10075 [Solibacillus sp. FSL R5-0691]|uniref:hypothetical protein n=1 Tax=Solibacillus sp. FSL R5-0691 TaxID=2921653 RepID=UPI0030D0D237